MTKIKQLYKQILVRDGVMFVGPADGGKTTVRNVLHKALDIIQTNLSQVGITGIYDLTKMFMMKKEIKTFVFK